jgi:hypothetical protein
MKITKLSVPISMTAALVGLVACAVSCAKKNNAPEKTPTPAPQPASTNAVTDNTVSATSTNISLASATNLMATNLPAVAQEITNPPPAETTTKVPETTSLTDTNLPGHTETIEMPTNAPVAPTSFYPAAMTTNATSGCCMSPVGGVLDTNVYLALRGGYEHIYHGNNNDSYWFSAKMYAYGDALRESVGKNAWLVPDAAAEISTGIVPKPDEDPHPGSHDGMRFRADFTWPWFHWMYLAGNTNSELPYCKPMAFALGPTVNFGFDHLYHETDFRFANYGGVRLTFNRSGFIEYTVGRTEGFNSIRQQVVTELPFYESRDGEVRYYFRGLWNHGLSRNPDILEGGLFVEMPLGLLIAPEKWGDLVPFLQ